MQAEELAREVVAAGIRHYCASRRERIPQFVDRHFSLRGTLALHRAALGWDIVRTPVNLTMAAPAVAVHLAATGARRLGARRIATSLSRTRLLLRTTVAQRIEWLICNELLELSCDALTETILREPLVLDALRQELPHRQLRHTIAEYAGTRAAAAEIATGMLSLGTGALTLGKWTPGVASFAPMLASIMAQQTAISSFPLGAWLGAFWYGLFPAAPSAVLLFGISGGLILAGSVLAAFAGVIADPVQRLLGLHQHRLRKMVDAMERQMLDPAAPGLLMRDRYVARLLDVLDLATTTYRLT